MAREIKGLQLERLRVPAVREFLHSVDTEAQYNIQTAQLDTLLGVLLGEQLRPALESLGLLPLVTELKSLNDRLHELVGIRDLENIAKPDGQRQEALANAIAAYRALVRFVIAYQIINIEAVGGTDEALTLFIDLVNSIIERYRRNFRFGSNGSSYDPLTPDEDGENNGGDTGDENDTNEENSGTTGGGGSFPMPPGPGGDDDDLYWRRR